MSKIVKVITDPKQVNEIFGDRIDEIESGTSYDTVMHTVSDLKKALYDNREALALCAPQIGENLRLFVVTTAGKESNKFKVFLNPMVVSAEGLHLSRETNLSFPDKQFIIPRKDKIHVAYQTEDGHVTSETFVGVYAEIVQQMIEMLDGITLADYGLDLDDAGGPKAFDRASKKQQTELIGIYLESLKMGSAELDKEINENPELKLINDTINFRAQMLQGNIKPVDKDGNIVDEEYIKAKAKEKADKIIAEQKAK